MINRKQIGIIKYGKRLNTAKKFQSGGTLSSFAGGYNWREDPYEMMLMRQKMAREDMDRRDERAAYKARNSYKKPGKTKTENFKPFATLTGGLAGSRDHFQKQYDIEQKAYSDKIREYGNGWLGSDEAKLMHSKIVKRGIEYENRLKDERKLFDQANSTLKDQKDKDALAVSNNNQMFVYDGKNSKYDFIDVSKYTSNPQDYRAMSKGEYATWQENHYVPNSDVYIKDFLGGGAVGENTLDELYIDIQKDKVKYAVIGGKLGRKDSEGGILNGYITSDQIQQGITSYIEGTGSIQRESKPTIKTDPDAKESMMESIIKEVYFDVFNGVENKSGLTASLTAEVLKSSYNRKLLADIKDTATRAKRLHRMRQVALVDKFFDNSLKMPGAGSSKKEESTGGASKAKLSNTLGALFTHSYSGSGASSKKYVIDKNNRVDLNADKDKLVNVDSLELVMFDGVVTQQKLNISSDVNGDNKEAINRNATLGLNEELGKIKSGTEVYFSNGDSMRSVMKKDARGFVDKGIRIAPGTDVDMVIMPIDRQGNPVPGVMRDINILKLAAKKDLIKAFNVSPLNGEKISIDADKLLPGNKIDANSDRDIKNFNEFVQMGRNFAAFKKEYDDNPNATTKANFNRAERAKKAMDKLRTGIGRFKDQGGIRLGAFGAVQVVMDAEYGSVEIADALGKDRKDMLSKASPDEHTFAQDIGMDKSGWGFSDDHWSATVFVPLKSEVAQSALKGTPGTVQDAVTLNEIQNGFFKMFEKEFIVTSGDDDTLYSFIKI